MKITARKLGSVTVLSPAGAVAAEDVEAFQQALEEHRHQSAGRLVLDFAEVTFLDSRGIEALWDFADALRAEGRAARLAAVQEVTREILELTGVAAVLDLYDTSESAVRSFG